MGGWEEWENVDPKIFRTCGKISKISKKESQVNKSKVHNCIIVCYNLILKDQGEYIYICISLG